MSVFQVSPDLANSSMAKLFLWLYFSGIKQIFIGQIFISYESQVYLPGAISSGALIFPVTRYNVI